MVGRDRRRDELRHHERRPDQGDYADRRDGRSYRAGMRATHKVGESPEPRRVDNRAGWQFHVAPRRSKKTIAETVATVETLAVLAPRHVAAFGFPQEVHAAVLRGLAQAIGRDVARHRTHSRSLS